MVNETWKWRSIEATNCKYEKKTLHNRKTTRYKSKSYKRTEPANEGDRWKGGVAQEDEQITVAD